MSVPERKKYRAKTAAIADINFKAKLLYCASAKKTGLPFGNPVNQKNRSSDRQSFLIRIP